MVTLAQSTSSTSEALFWIGLLILVVLLGGIVVFWLRRRLFADDRASADPGSILESMRAMRDSGEMSDDEFRQARDALVRRASTRSGDAPPPTPTAAPRTPATPDPTERRAEPGFDLTGAPLPPRDGDTPR